MKLTKLNISNRRTIKHMIVFSHHKINLYREFSDSDEWWKIEINCDDLVIDRREFNGDMIIEYNDPIWMSHV